MKYFYGKELEGKYKGLNTLFIAGSGNIDEINERLDYLFQDNKNVQHLYFGAYWQTPIENWNIVKHFSEYYLLKISVEVLIEEWVNIPNYIKENENIHLMLTYKTKDNIKRNNLTIKLENKDSILCYTDYISNDYSEYSNDIDLTNI